MNTSKVDPLPHQIEAVYGYVLKLPRIRFLIADDPGAGKTIMAGLIIKELKLRHLINRILIVVPWHLKDQWRREMKERFEEGFTIIDRGIMGAFYGENVWSREQQIITSIDFAKRDDVLPTLASSQFDLIIVDEAHKMAAYRYGDKLNKTGRYRLGEALSKIAEHLLFLTATPHKGDPENFRLFLDLLEPGFFATSEMLEESISRKDNPLFIRRIKEDLKNFEGEPLFLPRNVKTLTFNLGTDSPAEKELYNDLSEYVNTQYNKALTRDKKRNVAFALVILQRRLAFGESLATHYIDYTRIKEMADRAREYRLIPEYTEAFFKKAFGVVVGRLRELKSGFLAIDSIPFDIRQIAEEDPFKKRCGSILKAYPIATFDKEKAFKNPDAEFISFGHPLFEAILEWVDRTTSTSLQQGAVFKDPGGEMDGTVLFYEGEIMDGRGSVAGKRLFAFYVDRRSEEIEMLNPAFLWDLVDGESAEEERVDLEMLKGKTIHRLLPALETYKTELSEERGRQSRIKERYGVKSLEYLIVKLDGDLIGLYDRREMGENVDLVIRNKEERKKWYEIALEKLVQTIQAERILTMSTPDYVAAIRIVPAVGIDPAMKRDD